ncbi:MAG: J domain-containing protein [Deltaproteobacteria bacterium]|nr:J domain-containing protein [Deltaproteobacteria bacterium]
MTYEELQNAAKILNLPDKASWEEIRERYRALVKLHHPDKGDGNSNRIREINSAYDIVTAYCRDYRFSFSREEFYEQNVKERLRMQFGQEPF